jgi:predicted RNase H-like nuclease (RuvC/YqgF family)
LEEKIMTRRNLSDVLRQEATKEATDLEPKAESSANSVANPAKAASRTRKSSTDTSVADQTAQIQELKAALAQGAEQEKAFQAQIKTLATKVKQQQQQIKTFETEQGQSSKLKTELAEAKEVILQLSEANTQMSKTLDELKNPPQNAKARASLAVRPLPRHSLQLKPSENIDKPKVIDVGWMD